MWYVKRIKSDSPAGLITKVKIFLAQYEVISAYLTENFLTFMKENGDFSTGQQFFAMLHDDEIIAVWNIDEHNTFMHCFPNLKKKNAAVFFKITKKFFLSQPTHSIVGEKKFSILLKNFLCEQCGYTTAAETNYNLLIKNTKDGLTDTDQKINRPQNTDPDINCGVCEPSDIDALVSLQMGYEMEELNVSHSSQVFSRKYLLAMMHRQTLFKAEINGEIICKAHTNAIGINCKQLGGVYTVPKYRNKGYAKKLLQYAVSYLEPTTEYLVLFVKTDNTAANKLYKDLGFKKYCGYRIIHIRKV